MPGPSFETDEARAAGRGSPGKRRIDMELMMLEVGRLDALCSLFPFR